MSVISIQIPEINCLIAAPIFRRKCSIHVYDLTVSDRERNRCPVVIGRVPQGIFEEKVCRLQNTVIEKFIRIHGICGSRYRALSRIHLRILSPQQARHDRRIGQISTTMCLISSHLHMLYHRSL